LIPEGLNGKGSYPQTKHTHIA